MIELVTPAENENASYEEVGILAYNTLHTNNRGSHNYTTIVNY
mgnify:FL=1